MSQCPNVRGDPDTGEWCILAEQDHRRLEQFRDGYDRILALAWDLETITDQLAANCTDRELVAEYLAWKMRRNQ